MKVYCKDCKHKNLQDYCKVKFVETNYVYKYRLTCMIANRDGECNKYDLKKRLFKKYKGNGNLSIV